MSSGERCDLINRVAGVILAGGQGTRLYPLTQTRCKPAVGFGGRYRLIDIPLSNALNSKISKLFVISQYFASDLQQHITATYRGGIDLLCPEETPDKKVWFEGTADAVRKNLDHLLKSPFDYFLILSGDQVYNIDFYEMIKFADEKKADMVVASLHVEAAEAHRMGVMKVDGSCHITEFHEKPKKLDGLEGRKGTYLASMGIYVFKREILLKLLREEGNDFGHHLIPSQVKKGNAYAYEYDGYWVDIGTIKSYYEANMALLDRKWCLDTYDEHSPIFTRPHNLPSPLVVDTRISRSLVSQGSIVEADTVDHSIIGVRCHVKKGTKIKNSILMGHQFYNPPPHQHLPKEFTIGENCEIENAIIDEHVCIGNRVRLVNQKKLETHDSKGVFIRNGIIIVTSGTYLPDGFVL